MGNAIQPTPFIDLPIPGDKLSFQDFSMTFPVDEDMKNYKEIANWIIGLGFPRQYGQYKDLENNWAGLRSDIALMILDSNQNPQHTVTYRDAFPTGLSGLNFDVKASDTTIPLATATFKYAFYDFDEVDQRNDTMTPADQ